MRRRWDGTDGVPTTQVHRFTELGLDPSDGAALGRGAPLKKNYHRLAARLHPDRRRTSDTAVQVLAEEVFKLISMAYRDEEARAAAGSLAAHSCSCSC